MTYSNMSRRDKKGEVEYGAMEREREREREGITGGFKFGVNQIEIGACILWWPYIFYCSLVILSTLVNSYGIYSVGLAHGSTVLSTEVVKSQKMKLINCTCNRFEYDNKLEISTKAKTKLVCVAMVTFEAIIHSTNT